MSIENVRLVETIVIDKDDPRYNALIKDTDPAFVQDRHGHSYDPVTGEPVTFANAYEERRYTHGFRSDK